MAFGPVYDFSVDYNTHDTRDILNIYKCFIRKKYNLNLWIYLRERLLRCI